MKTISTDIAGWTEAEIDRVYHPIPKDDGRRAVTLAYVIRSRSAAVAPLPALSAQPVRLSGRVRRPA